MLFKVSLVCCIIGIIALFVLSKVIEGQKVSVIDISEDMLGQKVVITGHVVSAYDKKSLWLLNVEDSSGKIDVIVEREGNEFRKGQAVTVTGIVSDYKGKMEVKAESIQTN